MWTSTSNQLSYDEAKQNANQACKNIKLVGGESRAFLHIQRQQKYFSWVVEFVHVMFVHTKQT